MANEFMRSDLICDFNNIIPRNLAGLFPQYPDGIGPNQICTVVGSTEGSNVIDGGVYINTAFQLDTANLWKKCFLVLLAFLCAFQAAQVVIMEKFPVCYVLSVSH